MTYQEALAELKDKRRAFVEEYLIDKNGAAAYRRAGYSAPNDHTASTGANRLLANVGIATAIRLGMEEGSQRLQLSADRTLLEVARLAYFDPRKLYNADGTLKPIHELDDDTAAAVAQVEVFEEFDGHGDERAQVGVTKKVKVWDKNSAIDKAMKHQGLYKEPPPAPPGAGGMTVNTEHATFNIPDNGRSVPPG